MYFIIPGLCNRNTKISTGDFLYPKRGGFIWPDVAGFSHAGWADLDSVSASRAQQLATTAAPCLEPDSWAAATALLPAA